MKMTMIFSEAPDLDDTSGFDLYGIDVHDILYWFSEDRGTWFRVSNQDDADITQIALDALGARLSYFQYNHTTYNTRIHT